MSDRQKEKNEREREREERHVQIYKTTRDYTITDRQRRIRRTEKIKEREKRGI